MRVTHRWRLHGRRLAALAFGDAPRWLRIFIGCEVIAVLAAAGVIAIHATMLVGPDERANVSYIEIVVDQHRLPVQDKDCISDALHRQQPASAYTPCAKLQGSSYEAFQPPLYYLVAAPVFAVVPGLGHKVYALRVFDVLLLAVAMLALWWLAFEVLGEHRPYGVAIGLCAFAIPGLVVYQTFVGNDALEMPLAIGVLAACARATRLPERRRPLLVAAVLFGAVLLTKLTSLYLAVPFAGMVLYRLWRRRNRSALVDGVLAAAIVLVLLAPWVALNEKRYHALTANQLAHEQQIPILNPRRMRFTWSQVPALDRTLTASYMPKTCNVPQPNEPGEPLRDPAAYLLLALILIGPLMLARRPEGMNGLFTLLPAGVEVLVLDVTYVAAQQTMDARYLVPTLPPFMLGLGLLLASRRRDRVRWMGYVAVVVFSAAVAFWITTALPDATVCTQRITG